MALRFEPISPAAARQRVEEALPVAATNDFARWLYLVATLLVLSLVSWVGLTSSYTVAKLVGALALLGLLLLVLIVLLARFSRTPLWHQILDTDDLQVAELEIRTAAHLDGDFPGGWLLETTEGGCLLFAPHQAPVRSFQLPPVDEDAEFPTYSFAEQWPGAQTTLLKLTRGSNTVHFFLCTGTPVAAVFMGDLLPERDTLKDLTDVESTTFRQFWWIDRPILPALELLLGLVQCTCGYNLKDNRTGVCPECGRRFVILSDSEEG